MYDLIRFNSSLFFGKLSNSLKFYTSLPNCADVVYYFGEHGISRVIMVHNSNHTCNTNCDDFTTDLYIFNEFVFLPWGPHLYFWQYNERRNERVIKGLVLFTIYSILHFFLFCFWCRLTTQLTQRPYFFFSMIKSFSLPLLLHLPGWEANLLVFAELCVLLLFLFCFFFIVAW